MNKIFVLAILSLGSQITFAQTTNPSPYCDASFDDQQGFPVDDHINSVSFGSLNNVSNNQYAAPHYVFYNNLSVANFNLGNTYTLTMNFSTAGGCGYGVWIDFNQNNSFEASEKIAGTTGTNMLSVGATPTITQPVTIPPTAALGNTRMRIRIVEDDNYNMTTTSELPCNASTSASDVMDWGETEDYTINITTTTGVNGIENNFTSDVFPNPSTGVLTLDTDNSITKSVEVCSIFGNIVYKETIDDSRSTIDLSNQPKGIYILRLMNADKILCTRRVVIQ